MKNKKITNWSVLSPIDGFKTVEEASLAEESLNWGQTDDPRLDACTLSFAATEISGIFNKIAGESCMICPLSADIPSVNLVLLLTPAILSRLRSLPIIAQFINSVSIPQSPQSFTIRTFTKDARTIYFIAGFDRTGTLYGAYELLNRLGVSWFSPDSHDTDIPHAFPALMPELNITHIPSFSIRGLMGENRADKDFLLWMARNKMNKWGTDSKYTGLCRKTGIQIVGGNHDTFSRYLPAAKYFDLHPEWYGLRSGKRSPNVHDPMGDNICLSNQDARKEVAANVVNALIDGDVKTVDIIQLWPFDHYDSWCECGECAKIGNKMDHMLLLAYDVRKEIINARNEKRLSRNVKVSVCAYHNTMLPPTQQLPSDFDTENIIVQFFVIERCYAHSFNSPECTETNKKLLDIFLDWTSPSGFFKGQIMIGEYYNVSTFSAMTVPLQTIMQNDIPFYHAHGVRNIDYMHPLVSNWGTHAFTNCLFSALIFDVSINVNQWISNFLQRRYGMIASQMQLFYTKMESAMRNCKPLRHYIGIISTEKPEKTWPLPDYRISGLNYAVREEGKTDDPENKNNRIFDFEHLSYSPSNNAVNDGPSLTETITLLNECSAILDEAMLQCADSEVAQRLSMDIKRFHYTWLLIRFTYHLVRVRLLEKKKMHELAKAEVHALRSIVEGLKTETVMCKSYTDSMFENGLTATFHSQTYETILKKYGLEFQNTNEQKTQSKSADVLPP